MRNAITLPQGTYSTQYTRNLEYQIKKSKERIATGVKISSCADDPATWSTANSLRCNVAYGEATKAGLSNIRPVFETAYTTVATIGAVLTEMADKVSAAMKGADKETAALELQALQGEIKSAISAAVSAGNPAGINMLDGSTPSVKIPLGWDARRQQIFKIFRPSDVYKISSSGNTGYLGGSNSVLDTSISGRLLNNRSDAQSYLNTIKSAIQNNSIYKTILSGCISSIDFQFSLTSNINGVLQENIGKLVDTNLDEEAAKLKALQARLAIAQQVLALINAPSNSPASNILRLFQR